MVDRTPQQFPGGEPDGITDNTAAIQAAIDAWQPGDQVVLSGGIFRTTSALLIPENGLIVKGDAIVRAKSGFSGPTMITVTGHGVIFDADGLQFDQDDAISSGVTIIAESAVGLEVLNVASRNTQEAFLRLESDTTDVLVEGCEHMGAGSGVVALDAIGLKRITLRNSLFEHPGIGPAGDGVRFDCSTHGASDVAIVNCVARGYIGEAAGQGMGFGFLHVTEGRIIGCRADDCEGDGFHFERECQRWLCADLGAENIGIPQSAAGNGSGLIAYDCDDMTVVLSSVRNCAFHGIALSGEGRAGSVPAQLRLNGLIERCTVDTTGRDGIHLTAQREFRIDRNAVRDPSLDNFGAFAGIHVAQQGGTTLESQNGLGNGNAVVLSGATSPLGAIVVRPQSVNVTIDGIGSTAEARVTEAGDPRVTESGDLRVLEVA